MMLRQTSTVPGDDDVDVGTMKKNDDSGSSGSSSSSSKSPAMKKRSYYYDNFVPPAGTARGAAVFVAIVVAAVALLCTENESLRSITLSAATTTAKTKTLSPSDLSTSSSSSMVVTSEGISSLSTREDNTEDGGENLTQEEFTENSQGTTTSTTTQKIEDQEQQQQDISHAGTGPRQAPAACGDTSTAAQCAYEIAMERAISRKAASEYKQPFLVPNLKELYGTKRKVVRNFFNISNGEDRNYVLNLIRIPKAGSSAMSVVARALAGCLPDGFPCCKYYIGPNRDRRQWECPRRDIYCKLIRGCGGHQTAYPPGVVTITSVREPTSRLLSAFFYEYPHRPRPEDDHTWTRFKIGFIHRPLYQNILTKMLNDMHPYKPLASRYIVTPESVRMAKRRLCDIEFFGLSHDDIGSMLLMYETPPFNQLLPNPVAFGLPAREPAREEIHSADEDEDDEVLTLRINNNTVYEEFKHVTFKQNEGIKIVEKYNRPDFEVYQFAVRLFCARVRETTLLQTLPPVLLSEIYKDCKDSDDWPTTKQLCPWRRIN